MKHEEDGGVSERAYCEVSPEIWIRKLLIYLRAELESHVLSLIL